MAHDPSLGYADYFVAPGSGGATLVPEVDAGGEHEQLYGVGVGLHHQSGVEMFGVRGFMSAPAQSKAAALVDVDVRDGDGSSTVSYVRGERQQHRQMGQAPLSLSLHGPPDAAASFMLHHHQLGVGGGEHRQAQHHHQQQQPAPAAPWQLQDAGASSWHLRGSRFLLPTQQLLQEFCSIPVETTNNKTPKHPAQEEHGGGGGSSSSASWAPPSPQIQTMDAAELQRLKSKLYTMLEEVDRRYRRYREQMRAVAGSFEAVAGERAAAVYTKMASRTISKHFRSLRDGVAAQVRAVRRALGEKDTAAPPGMAKGETPRLRALDQCLRQHKAYRSGMLESHPWRPQRGLPESAVSVLRAWLFEHFLHPYPSDVDKHILARQTGLSRSQVSNWFINARVRLWKPMVEEMYAEEMKDKEGSGGGGGGQSTAQGSDLQNPNTGGSYAFEDGGGGGGEQKPTRVQLHLHDAGSLDSVVSIGRMDQHQQSLNFGMMDHLDFDAYEAAGGQQGFGGGGVSLTLGLQQQADSRRGDVNVAFTAASPSSSSAAQQGGGAAQFLFMAGEQQMGGGAVHPAHGGQFGADAAPHYHRGLSATGFHLLHDLAG